MKYDVSQNLSVSLEFKTNNNLRRTLFMANKKTLKKQVNLICEELFVDFVAASLYGNSPNHPEAETILLSIAKVQKNYISRISHPEPGMPAKQYYKDLMEKFSKEVVEILYHINNL
jgi:hypothetical protein